MKQKSSAEHVAKCLSQLAVATSRTWKKDADGVAAFAVFTDKLVAFAPDVVTKACDEWGSTHERWPALGSLLKLCRSFAGEDSAQARLGDPNAPENFLARCKRVGGHHVDAIWVREHHHLLAAPIADHMAGSLSDVHLQLCLETAGMRRDAPAMPRVELSDAQRRARLAEIDQITAQLAADPGGYLHSRELLHMGEKMRAGRDAGY